MELQELVLKAEGGDVAAQVELIERRIIARQYEDAWLWANKAATAGDPTGLYCLAVCYLHGYGTKVDVDTAQKIFQTSADLGYARAYTGLAAVKMLKEGENFSSEILALTDKAAAAKDCKGLYLKAMLYHYGMGGAVKSECKYFSLLSEAAAQHYEPALWELACGCLDRKTVAYNPERAIALLNEAADLSSPRAIAMLSYIAMNNEGVNPAPGLEVIKRAAALGDPDALFFVGLCLLNGLGVEADEKKADLIIREAATQGSHQAREYIDNIEKEAADAEAIKLEQEILDETYDIANHGFPPAMTQMGDFCRTGVIVKALRIDRDLVTAADWYRSAADAGERKAAYHLAVLMQKGVEGLDNDPAEVERLFKMALEDPDRSPDVAVDYALFLWYNGRAAEAEALMQKEVADGNAHAMAQLAVFHLYGHGVEIDYDRAVALATASSDAGCVHGEVALGWIYRDREDEGRDLAKSMEHLQKKTEQYANSLK
ncbi:MAG: sel1 repeat family protein, partial [Muribaculaceae bacterium]|nr:sel1 repeat family protein [Muribaculaceae bacterium]